MRKLFVMMFAVCVMLAVCSISYAKIITVSGTVTDSKTLQPLAGVKIVAKFPAGWITVYTNYLGKYSFSRANWCDSPQFAVTKTGYYGWYGAVMDSSCWGCTPDCPPAYAEYGCKTTMTKNFKLIKNPFVKTLAERPEIATAENRKELVQILFGLWFINYCNTNICDYDCLYQGVVDFFNGKEFAFGHQTRPDIELPPCPDVANFADFVNDWLDAMWEYYYGDNFPDDASFEAEE